MNSNNYKGGFRELEGYVSEEKFAEREMQYEKNIKVNKRVYFFFTENETISDTNGLFITPIPHYPITKYLNA